MTLYVSIVLCVLSSTFLEGLVPSRELVRRDLVVARIRVEVGGVRRRADLQNRSCTHRCAWVGGQGGEIFAAPGGEIPPFPPPCAHVCIQGISDDLLSQALFIYSGKTVPLFYITLCLSFALEQTGTSDILLPAMPGPFLFFCGQTGQQMLYSRAHFSQLPSLSHFYSVSSYGRAG